MGMKVIGVIVAIGFVALLVATASPNPGNALDAMSRIKPGMTYSDVAKIVPLDHRNRLSVRENGGVFYDVPIDSKHLIQLRFEQPTDEKPVRNTKINYSPRLRNRNTLELIAGEEAPWPIDD